MKKVVLFFLLIIFLNSTFGQTCCSGGIPMSNNIGLVNEGKNNFQLGISYDFNNLNTLKVSSRTLDDNSRKRITHSVLLNAAYSFTDMLSLETLLTWVNQRRIIDQFGNTDLQQTNGISDAIVLVKYGFNKILGESSNVTIGLGFKAPLGSYDEVNDQGITYIADLQPGSGSWDLIFYSSFAKNFNFRPTTTFSGRAIYRSTGENDDFLNGLQAYENGEEVQLFVGISDEFVIFKKNLISPNITFKYRNAEKDKINNVKVDNTGGNWLFLIPGLSMSLSKNVLFQSRIEIPIISNVDGTQLTPTYRFTGGFLFNLDFKKESIINSNISNL